MELAAIKNMIFIAGFFTAFILATYFLTQAKVKIRLALIEKGIEPPAPHNYSHLLLKFAAILIGAASGILIGYLLNITLRIPEPVSYSSMILLCSGVAIIFNHLITNNRSNG